MLEWKNHLQCLLIASRWALGRRCSRAGGELQVVGDLGPELLNPSDLNWEWRKPVIRQQGKPGSGGPSLFTW